MICNEYITRNAESNRYPMNSGEWLDIFSSAFTFHSWHYFLLMENGAFQEKYKVNDGARATFFSNIYSAA